MATSRTHRRRREPAVGFTMRRSGLIWLIVTGLVVYLVAAGFSGLGKTLRIVSSANIYLLCLAMAAIAFSYVCAALTYYVLAVKRLKPWPTLIVQISGGLANRLLPGGLGGLGINAWYLHRRGHSVGVATAIVAANNTLGFIGNILLIGIILMLPGGRPHIHLPAPSPAGILAVVAMLVVITLISASPLIRRRLRGEAKAIRHYLEFVIRRPLRGLTAVISSMSLTSMHVIALVLVAHSLKLTFGWKTGLYAISAGALVGGIVPTPGGIGGAEAGIASILAVSGLSAGDAISTALLYRFLTYWLPLLPGYLALRIVEQKYL